MKKTTTKKKTNPKTMDLSATALPEMEAFRKVCNSIPANHRWTALDHFEVFLSEAPKWEIPASFEAPHCFPPGLAVILEHFIGKTGAQIRPTFDLYKMLTIGPWWDRTTFTRFLDPRPIYAAAKSPMAEIHRLRKATDDERNANEDDQVTGPV